MDPAPSVPIAATPMPVATATAAPPLDPPAVRSTCQGLRVTPVIWLTVAALQPNSEVLVLPMMIAPAARSRATAGASVSGTQSAHATDPRVVRRPAVGVRSFTDIGTPSNGYRCHARSPSSATIRSASRAAASAGSAATVTKAFSAGSAASIWRIVADTNSTGETARVAYQVRSSPMLISGASPANGVVVGSAMVPAIPLGREVRDDVRVRAHRLVDRGEHLADGDRGAQVGAAEARFRRAR